MVKTVRRSINTFKIKKNYKTIVRPVKIYGFDCCEIERQNIKKGLYF